MTCGNKACEGAELQHLGGVVGYGIQLWGCPKCHLVKYGENPECPIQTS